jgi:hypothetical protein
VTNGGWEYNAVLIAATLAVVEDECGPAWALAAGAAGVAGSFAASELAKRAGEAEEEFQPVPFQAPDEPERELAHPTGGETPQSATT